MQKETLLTLLSNLYDDLQFCECLPAKKKLEKIMEKIAEEGVQ